MIVAALLLHQAAPAADPANDVVVIGQRLERWKASIKFTKSGPQCNVRQSSGDTDIDAIGCAAMTTCFPPFQSRFQATGDRAIPPDTKKIMQAALNQELTTCVTGKRRALIAELAAKRAAARAGS